MFPEYTPRERVADGCVHVVGITACLAAIAAMMALAVPALPPLPIASLAIYGGGLVAMFCCSAGYNMIARPNWKLVMRRCDHAAIFIMIAGTYTPFGLIAIGGPAGYWLLAGVWGVALIGAAAILLVPRRAAKLTLGIYLLQGWAVLLVLDPLRASISEHGLQLLLAGGCLYTIGVVFHLWRRLPFHNAIWHLFVLVAASCHYLAVLDAVALA